MTVSTGRFHSRLNSNVAGTRDVTGVARAQLFRGSRHTSPPSRLSARARALGGERAREVKEISSHGDAEIKKKNGAERKGEKAQRGL